MSWFKSCTVDADISGNESEKNHHWYKELYVISVPKLVWNFIGPLNVTGWWRFAVEDFPPPITRPARDAHPILATLRPTSGRRPPISARFPPGPTNCSRRSLVNGKRKRRLDIPSLGIEDRLNEGFDGEGVGLRRLTRGRLVLFLNPAATPIKPPITGTPTITTN